ncbi:MAG: hypothetical protein P8K68_05755 [Algibacter sp.]|uniref:hypothetical protein n=1 Tax=Algibacter sp. TaxID=1872428 RepID=UPI00262473F2|nr:hypothetical protein [Algibacter sp.]MDG1731283.1 hypothetical protein [Algibacter sp.]MDG2178281.1 hypothetical protein [Algibacter sp.]
MLKTKHVKTLRIQKEKRNLIVLVFLFLSTTIFAQYSNAPGIPFIKNFTEESTNKNLTIYGVSQSSNGIMYFATAGALLEYDGIRWISYTAGKESDLRAVLYKDDKHIYTSGHGGFGYWSKNETGKLEYTSLFFKEPLKESPLLPIFSKIKEVNGKILFQTFQQIFIFDPLKNTLDSISALKGFNLLFSSNNRVFIQDTGMGLFEITENNRSLIKGTDQVKFHIVGVVAENTKALLVVTRDNGIWGWKNNVFSKKQWVINDVIEKHLANNVQVLDNNYLVIGTIRNGVYIVSPQGKVLFHIEKNNGLLDNTVRTLFIDLNQNLWLGMEQGLSYVQINSNTRYLIDTEGEFGTVYTSHLKDSLLYLGTNQGLFAKNIFDSKSVPELIDKGIGQVWSIEEVNNQLLVGTHEGVFSVDNKKIKPIHYEGGAWVFKKHPKLDDVLYVGFYSGVAVFKNINGVWQFVDKWQNYGESSRFIEFDKYGHMWVAHPSKGYYRLLLSDDGMELKAYEFYGVSNKFVDIYAYLCKIDTDLVFYNPKGFFNYDPIDNAFITAKYPSVVFKDIKGINSISQQDNMFWYSTLKSLGYVSRIRNQFKTIEEPFHSIRNKHLNDFNTFKKINDSVFGIGINNGMFFHNINNQELDAHKVAPMFRSIEFISTTDTIVAPINQNEKLEVPNHNNFLKVSIALPKMALANSKKIQYKLNGLNKEWSNWENLSELNFPGLASGNYILELRSGDEKETNPETISKAFYIKPPWYLTHLAFVVYGLLLLIINYSYRAYFKRKSKKQMTVLKSEEQEKRQRQEEKFELDRLEAERKMLILREENLNLEIKKKNSELASSTLNNIKKNELLSNLIEDIEKIDKNVLNSSLHSPINKVIKKINNHLVDKDDWLTFELHFRNAHADFFDKLREKHANLSSNEIKLSAYLKLNLSSKEIASLMNISIKSVEQGRWRLRKKLDLPKDASLTNYIQSF